VLQWLGAGYAHLGEKVEDLEQCIIIKLSLIVVAIIENLMYVFVLKIYLSI
jgi:hypothetical protein